MVVSEEVEEGFAVSRRRVKIEVSQRSTGRKRDREEKHGSPEGKKSNGDITGARRN